MKRRLVAMFTAVTLVLSMAVFPYEKTSHTHCANDNKHYYNSAYPFFRGHCNTSVCDFSKTA